MSKCSGGCRIQAGVIAYAGNFMNAMGISNRTPYICHSSTGGCRRPRSGTMTLPMSSGGTGTLRQSRSTPEPFVRLEGRIRMKKKQIAPAGPERLDFYQ